MTIEALKHRWEQDSEAFKNKEIGELQDFIKEVLQEKELFNLRRGNLATADEHRTNEFTIETEKKRRRADFVIFIKGVDIVIPVEVEKHGNIKKGEEQLFQYQRDWDKKYGILTDGNQWKFYRSNIPSKPFFIQDIFNNPQNFTTHWQDYIKPENYYPECFAPSGQLFSDNKIDLNKTENRELFFDDITKVITNFRVKMKAIGGFENLPIPENDKLALETSYAYLIQFILYKVLVDNSYKKFTREYDNMLEKIKKALVDRDFYSIIINEIKNISEYISKYIYNPFAKEQQSINQNLIKNLKEDLTIDEIAPWLDLILFINKYNFAGLKNEIFGFIYENYLKDLYSDKNKGQYFTDPAVVNFMTQEIGYTENEIKKRETENKISIIDASCGAGTFLYSAVDRLIDSFDDGTKEQAKHIAGLIDKNIFGLDIAEFPLYLAEMNILMRMLPLIVNDSYENPIEDKLKIFKTKDSIAEFLETGINATVEEKISLFEHLEKTDLGYRSFMRDPGDLKAMLESLQANGVRRERFDYVIGNPPYIGYNECCKQKIEFTQKIKDHEDVSITLGNVYGMNLHSTPNNRKKYPPKPNLYAFFIALGLALLKNDGKMAYIIPQTILTAGDLDVLRYHLAHRTTIKKIITFEGNMFIGRGLKQNRPVPTSSLIFILQKSKPNKKHKIKIINYKPYTEKQGTDFEEYINSKNKSTKEILQSELQELRENWNFIKWDKIFIDLYSIYKINTDSIFVYYNHKTAKAKFNSEFYFDIGYIIDNSQKTPLKTNNYIFLNFSSFKGYSLYKENLFYPKNHSSIKLAKNSQGYITLESKYKILWSVKNPHSFFITDKEIIFNMGYSNIISSNNRQEIYYLFSILNSKINFSLLKLFLKLENEKDFYIPISAIKNFIKVPKITDKNKSIKQEIIKQTEKLLALEDLQLKDFVDFTTTIQKFEQVEVQGDNLILTNSQNNKVQQKINSKTELIKDLIEETYNQKPLQEISLHDLKYTPAIDKQEQAVIKDYIDDLVFTLYFIIPIKKIGIEQAQNIKTQCLKNQYYQYIH